MNRRRTGLGIRLAIAALAAAWPLRSRALFGVGDIVFDPANVAQTINVLVQAEHQVDLLGQALGVSTRQFDELVQLAAIAGNPAISAAGAPPPSSAGLQTLLQNTPGFGNSNAGPLLNSSGQLDAFLGLPLSSWIAAVENPVGFYRQALVAPAVERAGAAAGLGSDTLAYVAWYAGNAGEDQFNSGPRAASDFAQLTTSDWLQESRQRRVNLQTLAAGGLAAETQAAAARTQADQQSSQTQLAATANRILLETAAQNADATEAQVRTAGAQQRLEEEESDRHRDAAEMALDAAD